MRRENSSQALKVTNMLVREILAHKGHAVHTCHADDTLASPWFDTAADRFYVLDRQKGLSAWAQP